jgi:DNA invertase Pin-like site-specific DNA recombinase
MAARKPSKTTPTERRRAVIYGRQSRTIAGSASREDQERAGIDEAERHNLEVTAVLLEPPSTGAYKNRGKDRPRWMELLELVRTGKVDVVIALKTDRLSRGGGPGWAPLIEAAEAAGLDPDRFVLIVGGGFMSEFELGIRAAMDREESRKTSDRLNIAFERMAVAGKPHGGARPFGYASDQVTVVEEEADLLRRAARRILAGEAIYAICREWNEAGVRTSFGREWQPTTLRRVLSAPRLAGLRQHGTDDEGVRVIIGPAVWEPILDRATWERIEAKLRPKPTRQRASTYLLTGVIHCVCGYRMYGNAPVSKGVLKPARYACLAQPGRPGCGRTAVMAAPVEEAVIAEMLHTATSKDFAKVLRRDRGTNVGNDRAEADLVDAETRLLELAEEYGAGQLRRGEWLAMKRGAETRLEAARAKVTSVQRQALIEELDDVDTLADRFPKMTFDRQRVVIAAVIESVVVNPVGKGWRRSGASIMDRVTIIPRA